MYIFPLQQALCSDRSQVSFGPDPKDWIVPSLPEGWRLVSFHFFVNWESFPPVVADRIWMTRQLRFDSDINLARVDDSAISDIFNQSCTGQEFDDLNLIFSPCGHKITTVLLPEIPLSAISDETPVWIVAKSDELNNRVHKVTVSGVKSAIQNHSGGPVWVGDKGLTYGTSAVECYLSKSDAAFPGDVDAVIVDNQNQVRFIVEYKKHNLQTPLGEHLITQYYPRPDGRKYQRLAALANRYEHVLQRSVPLVVLYYSTRQPVIRLQEIGSLGEDRATISRDTGDISTNDRHQKEISDFVVNWLGV